MLYIFAGYQGKLLAPGTAHLTAGGLQHCIEEVEKLAELEHDSMIRYAKEGVYAVPLGSNVGERLGAVEYVLSPALEREGITWRWFPEHYGFGNGVSCPKSTADRETMLVDHRTGNPILDLIATGHPIELGKLIIQQVPKRTEGWVEYEKRWRAGTCPQESHIVDMTCIITKGRLGHRSYNRIQKLIEDPSATLMNWEAYDVQRHFTVSRKWDGKPESKERLKLLEGLR